MSEISPLSLEPEPSKHKLLERARYIEHKFAIGRAYDIQPECVQDILQIIVEFKKRDSDIDSNEVISSVESFCYAALTDYKHADSKQNYYSRLENISKLLIAFLGKSRKEPSIDRSKNDINDSVKPKILHSKLHEHARYIKHKFAIGRAHDIQPEHVQDILRIIIELKELDSEFNSRNNLDAIEFSCYAALTDYMDVDTREKYYSRLRFISELISNIGNNQGGMFIDRDRNEIIESIDTGVTMSIFDDLENGTRQFLEELKTRIGQNDAVFYDALNYQSQLFENIAHATQFGETNDTRAKRNQIIYELNRLSLKHLGKDFNGYYLFLASTEIKDRVLTEKHTEKLSNPANSIVEKPKRKLKKKQEKIFISHSNKDKDFVIRLSNDLKIAGYQIWYSGWEIKVGNSIVKKINEGLAESSHLAVVLSPNSVTSEWVQRELNSVLMEQLSKRNITILPILYQECEIPLLLRDILYADMSTNYKAGLEQLLQALADE